MDLSRQAHYTWKNGQHLSSVDGLKFRHDLHKLHSFFVEVVYNLELCQVESIEGFRDSDKLIMYTEEVDISQLL